MTERLGTAKNGLETAFLKDIAIHSSYDPYREAERFIASAQIKKNASYFICVEPGLGYVMDILKRLYPNSRVIALHCSPFFAGRGAFDAEWHPGCRESLAKFLGGEIPDYGVFKVQLVEWKPSMAAYGEAYSRLLGQCVDFLKRAAANIRTSSYFGPRWLKNIRKNLAGLSSALAFSTGTVPVIVTGAGPGLEGCLGAIKAARGAFVLAAASSAPALLDAGITPSLILSCDGGNWARPHLIDFERLTRRIKKKPVVAAGIYSALTSQTFNEPVLLLSDSSSWQDRALNSFNLPFLPLPQRGTVSAQAIDLAFCLTTGPVFLAGMELANRDLISHARPYSLDYYIDGECNRLKPGYSLRFERADMVKRGDSLAVYAAWFREEFGRSQRRAAFLGERPAWGDFLPGAVEVSVPPDAKMPEFSVFSSAKAITGFADILVELLRDATVDSLVIRELADFLGMNSDTVTAKDLLLRVDSILRAGNG